MMPKKEVGAEYAAEYTALCGGLERMACLYKSKKSNPSGRKKPKILRVLGALRKRWLRREYQEYRLRKSEVDRLLPEASPAVRSDGFTGERSYFSSERIAVYTAEFGRYDNVLEPVIQPDNIDYYLITDQKPADVRRFKVLDFREVVPEEYRDDPLLANRWCKMHPHKIFPDYRASVYIDANYLIVSDLTDLINRMEDYPVAMFRHKNRTCVYEEVEACLIKNKAPKEALLAHKSLLEQHGVPENYGLLEATVIARHHQDPRCAELMEKWWDAFRAGAGRDQIALIDVLWEMKILPSVLGTLGANLDLCDLFIRMPHGRIGNK